MGIRQAGSFFYRSSAEASSAGAGGGGAPISLHPLVDQGVGKGDPAFSGGTMTCRCESDPVEITVDSQVAHNHLCGCSKCWKPDGALFSLIGVVPRDKLSVTRNGHKLKVLDQTAVVQRHVCTQCGVHLFGRIEERTHPFYGLDFVHTELSSDEGWAPPEFAAFVSSLIESGFPPESMGEVRGRLEQLGLPAYDCLSPPLMDAIATANAKRTARPAAE